MGASFETMPAMSTVLEIEKAIEHLPPQDFEALADRMSETRARRVDASFEQLILLGKFDDMAAQATRDMEAGRCTPLDEFVRRA